jgi:hypothetical protein
MKSEAHEKHLATRVAHNNCGECRADCERQFLRAQWPGYKFVADYLAYAKPRLAAQDGSVAANRWYREFLKALNERITLKGGAEKGRKCCHSYLERLGNALGGRNPNAAYLRQFAAKGASAL